MENIKIIVNLSDGTIEEINGVMIKSNDMTTTFALDLGNIDYDIVELSNSKFQIAND